MIRRRWVCAARGCSTRWVGEGEARGLCPNGHEMGWFLAGPDEGPIDVDADRELAADLEAERIEHEGYERDLRADAGLGRHRSDGG